MEPEDAEKKIFIIINNNLKIFKNTRAKKFSNVKLEEHKIAM